MNKIRSLADLQKMREDLKFKSGILHDQAGPEGRIRVRVAMATCGIASGSKEVMEVFLEEFAKRNIEALVTQTGCMGYCYAEPTVEISVPGKDPVTFGYVDGKKVSKIIDRYILNNELVDGIIPVNYESIDQQ